jgi:hypothetical protein
MLTGYKTKIGAAGLILTGLGMVAKSLSEGFNWTELSDGIGIALTGLAAWGIGHKIERQ